jgi:hypothetical protein
LGVGAAPHRLIRDAAWKTHSVNAPVTHQGNTLCVPPGKAAEQAQGKNNACLLNMQAQPESSVDDSTHGSFVAYLEASFASHTRKLRKLAPSPVTMNSKKCFGAAMSG